MIKHFCLFIFIRKINNRGVLTSPLNFLYSV